MPTLHLSPPLYDESSDPPLESAPPVEPGQSMTLVEACTVPPEKRKAHATWIEQNGLQPIHTIRDVHMGHHNPHAPQLYYGVGLTWEALARGNSLIKYAKDNGLYPHAKPHPMLLFIVQDCLQHLSRACRRLLRLEIPCSAKYDLLVSIYDNRELKGNRMDRDKELRVINKVLEAVDDEEQEPMWYYDGTDTYSLQWL